MGEQIITALGRPIPPWYEKIKQNKWMYGIGTWFVGNNIQSSLISTGAFEVYINDVLAYSKIQAGRMPDMGIILQVFAEHGIHLTI